MLLFFSALRLVIVRSLANWRLLSSIVIGVVVAVAFLSSIPFFSNALTDLGLRHMLRQSPGEFLNVQASASSNILDFGEYKRIGTFVGGQMSTNIGSVIRQEASYIKSANFLAAWADRPVPPGDERPRVHFQVFTNLEKHITLVEGRYADSLPAGLSPKELADPGLEIEVLIGSETAAKLGLGVDDLFILSDYRSGAPRQITLRLTGIIDPIDPDEEFWFGFDDIFTVPLSGNDPITYAPCSFRSKPCFKVLTASYLRLLLNITGFTS